jgi:uncharacterized protein
VAVIYVCSVTERSGKTLLALGLAKTWQESGKKIGYLKLATPAGAGESGDDPAFAQRVLGLSEPLEDLSGSINPNEVEGSTKMALGRVSAGKDLVVVEGLPPGASRGIVDALGASALVIHDYAAPLASSLEACRKLGDRCLGIVLNKVPRSRAARFQGQAAEEIKGAGQQLLGLIPEERLLMTLSVGELAAAVQGKINNSPEKAGELIENFMLGASTFDRGPAYYNRKTNKAVILWGERPGFRKAALAGYQIAALGTSTKCIVLSANGAPAPNVLEQASGKGIPIISAPGDVTAIATAIDGFIAGLRFRQEMKMPKLVSMITRDLDLGSIARKVGLAS